MSLTLRKASVADVASMADIYFSAFTIDAISLLCFPRSNQAVYDWWFNMITEELSDPQANHLVITAPSTTNPSQEEVIAWALWNAPSPTPPSASTATTTDLPTWPAGCDVVLANHFFGNLVQRRKRIMDPRPYWYLEIIATRPDWQGKGAAGKLLRWGLERADQQGVEVYLEASPDGKPIYEHFGFEEVERLVVDLDGRDPCGTGEEEFVEVMMVRPARKMGEDSISI